MSTQPPTPPYPQPRPAYQQAAWQPPPTNATGLTGFILSLGGLIACGGLLCPIGFIVSLFGLRKEPRGFAIAGVVIGGVGTLLGAALSYGIYMAAVSNTGVFGMFNYPYATSSTMYMASNDIDTYYTQHNTLPDEATGTTLVSNYTDEWGTPIAYKPGTTGMQDYELLSAGPDLQFGTSDDYVEPFYAFSNTASAFNAAEEEPEAQAAEIDFTFNQASLAIGGAFPPGSTMPDEATGSAVIANLRDAWGRAFDYSPTDSSSLYHLKSAGPDGVWHNEDDIVHSFYFEPTGP